VLLNLVGNAIKFTDQGEVAIKASATNGSITVSVRDSGPGITEADQAKIFEEFQQAESINTREKGGTGLGLTISKRIVELHGCMGAESGSNRSRVRDRRFHLRFPSLSNNGLGQHEQAQSGG
jgi:signal transduction histidine kinase